MFIDATWLLDYSIIAYEQGIYLLAWMGWNADIEGCGLGERCTYDKIIQKLEDENVSLDFKVQSLIKERDNAKMEYRKLFDSIKKTRSQTQKEMDELIDHVSEKTYAYGVIHAENQNLLVYHI
ncbi:hypothetical protein Tco_0287047 [Tanacetum coccineum]